MIIIKDFSSQRGVEESVAVEFCQTYFMGKNLVLARVLPEEQEGEILLKKVCPTLVKKYQGLEIHLNNDITIALFSSHENTYKAWNGNEWTATSEPTFQEVAVVNEGLPCWTGDLQIRLHLDKTAQWINLRLGYEVNIDIDDWLLKFGLVNYLSEPLDFSCVTHCSNGLHLLPPPYVDINAITNCQVQPINGKCLPANIESTCNRITLTEPIAPGTVQLHYQLTPKIDYIYGEHQISESPCVTVRSLGQSDSRQSMSHFKIGDNYNEVIYFYNLNFELVIIAADIKDARTIARQFFSKMRSNALLHAYPIDFDFAVEVSHEIRENPLTDVEGDLPSVTLFGKIHNIPTSYN